MVHNTKFPLTVTSTFQKCYVSGNSFDIIDQTTGSPIVGTFPLTSIGTLYLKDSLQNYSTYVQSSLLTADRTLKSGDWSGTICTTVNPVPTYVGSLSNRHTSRTQGQFQAFDATNNPLMTVGQLGGQGFLIINDSASTGANKFVPNVSGQYVNACPRHDGEIALNSGGNANTTLSSSSTWIITHGLGWTPNRIMTQPRSLINPANSYYVSAITSTTFTITFNLPISGVFSMDWQAY
jgi:hypothetical protein